MVLCFWLDARVLQRRITHPPIPQDDSVWAKGLQAMHSERMKRYQEEAALLVTQDLQVALNTIVASISLNTLLMLMCAARE